MRVGVGVAVGVRLGVRGVGVVVGAGVGVVGKCIGVGVGVGLGGRVRTGSRWRGWSGSMWKV